MRRNALLEAQPYPVERALRKLGGKANHMRFDSHMSYIGYLFVTTVTSTDIPGKRGSFCPPRSIWMRTGILCTILT
jgi:hypothetical protein